MAKDYAKLVARDTRPKQRRLTKKLIFVSFGVFLGLALAYLVFVNVKNDKSPHPRFKAVISSAMAFLNPKKDREKEEVYPQPIQFNFYDELPNRQMVLAEKLTYGKNKNPEVQYAIKVESKLKHMPAIQAAARAAVVPRNEALPRTEVAALPQPAETSNTSEARTIFNPEEIASEIHPIHLKSYKLQLGSFESKSGADMLIEALLSAGLKADVVKVKVGSTTQYQVQQGPFATAAEAQLAQSKLKKRGVTSLIES